MNGNEITKRNEKREKRNQENNKEKASFKQKIKWEQIDIKKSQATHNERNSQFETER